MLLPMAAVQILTEVIVAAIAVIFLVYARRLQKRYLEELEQYSVRTEGTVARQWKKEVEIGNGETSTTWYVDYRYAVGGQVYEACSGQGHYKKMFQDGKTVEVRCKAEAPEEFYVPEENGHDRMTYKILYALGIIVIGIGVAFLILFHLVFGR